MGKETDFYTATMARVYSEQGHWDKAAEIYRHLLAQEPEREDYLAALAEMEKKAKQKHQKSLEDLDDLFHQWFDLMLKYKNLLKLRALNR
ncbi:MAG: tetratricopeptide repeat protein [Deltaproteobacteria bacterium]|jgi:tetratricopeptide (TPR) repeat protein|nr:tetratricopeptide repeat protein [Deltaproteobacteria bacterium]